MANPPAKKNASKASGNKSKVKAGRPAGLFTWVAVFIVVIAVATIVIVKVTNGSSKLAFGPTSSKIVNELTEIPASTFDTIGINSTAVAVSHPQVAVGEPMLQWADANGVKRPTVFYYGAEYCPFCAAERWPVIIALSRFGTWSNLYDMLSASDDVYPNTPTFTFLHASYTSNYINFISTEVQDRAHQPLQTPTAAQLAVVQKFDAQGNIPFASFGNQTVLLQASPLPSAFTNASRDEVASALSDPTNPLTKGIIASANYLTASICKMTGQAPSAVCNSSGVKAAKASMGI